MKSLKGHIFNFTRRRALNMTLPLKETEYNIYSVGAFSDYISKK